MSNIIHIPRRIPVDQINAAKAYEDAAMRWTTPSPRVRIEVSNDLAQQAEHNAVGGPVGLVIMVLVAALIGVMLAVGGVL